MILEDFYSLLKKLFILVLDKGFTAKKSAPTLFAWNSSASLSAIKAIGIFFVIFCLKVFKSCGL